MNLSFCFFFSGMFPSIWWWERGVSEGIDILCIILQCWVAKLDEHGTKLTNGRKDKLEKSNKSKAFNSAFNAYCCGLGLLMATQGVTVWWYCTKIIMFNVLYLQEVKCQVFFRIISIGSNLMSSQSEKLKEESLIIKIFKFIFML